MSLYSIVVFACFKGVAIYMYVKQLNACKIKSFEMRRKQDIRHQNFHCRDWIFKILGIQNGFPVSWIPCVSVEGWWGSYLTMKSEWASVMMCFSDRMCSCCLVSTIWRFFRIFMAKVLASSFFSCTWEHQRDDVFDMNYLIMSLCMVWLHCVRHRR